MSKYNLQGFWVIAASFLVALLLNIFPIPEWMKWARPEWVALVLVYWVIALPQRVGILIAWFLGIMIDSLEGAVLGQNALSLSVVAYLSIILYQRLRMYAIWQQAMVVCILISVHLLIGQWVENFDEVNSGGFLVLLPAMVSALFWPWVMLILRSLRRQYRII
tara:strand:- start:182 stop:670 length:489 start_codon:yes stop_codon:yes gene_type:complete